MSSAPDMAARHAAILGELAEIGLTVARELQARLLAAETTQEAAQAADSLHRVSRTVRQSLALEAKLARDEAREVETVSLAAQARAKAEVEVRTKQVTEAVERLIWTETQSYDFNLGPDADEDELDEARDERVEDLEAELAYQLRRAVRSPAFLDAPPADLAARLSAVIGLKGAPEPEPDLFGEGPPDALRPKRKGPRRFHARGLSSGVFWGGEARVVQPPDST